MDIPRTTTAPALVGRLLWMMVGPITLMLLTLSIMEQGGGWLTFPSLAYFPVLGATVLGRWVEFRLGDPKTTTGEPATAENLRRYVFGAGGLGLAIWVAAHVLGTIG